MILEAALASAGHRLDKLLFKDGRASWLWHQGRQGECPLSLHCPLNRSHLPTIPSFGAGSLPCL